MKQLLKFMKGYEKESILAPMFKCLEAIFELLVPLAVAQIVDVGIRQGNSSTVYKMCGLMILLGVIGLVCAISAQYFAARAAVGFAEKLRSTLFAHIQSFSYETTDKLGTSSLITRMTGDVNSVQTGINMFLRLFMRSPFIVFGAMIMAFTIDVKLALIFAVTIPVLAVVVFGIMLIGIPLMKKSQAHLDRVLGKVRGNYNGTRVIRAFNKEEDEIRDFDERNQALTKLQRISGSVSALMNPLTYVIVNTAIILLIQKGAIAVDVGRISQGELIALYNYMSQILVELIKLASLIITLNKAAASAQRISDVLQTPSDVVVGTDGLNTDTVAQTVKFEQVSYRYSASGDHAVHGADFCVERGQTVGIIGGTGSGKTTLMNLLAGFYHPTEGNIWINGKNIALYEPSELREMFGIVPQKAQLFQGTIRSNLLWGHKNATDEELWKALELAQADDFVREKAERLDEPVQEHGSNFSGGQRQRLTIARALMKKPQFLILDDSASALDYVTESHLRSAIKHLKDVPTTFIVSQRTSSILHADLILVMDDGEIVAQGTHETLLQSCEIYREIYDSQVAGGSVS